MRKLYELNQDEQETYYNYYSQLGKKEGKEYLERDPSKILLGLVPSFTNLVISSLVMNSIFLSLEKTWGKEKRNKVKNLRRRGIIVIEITDKKYEETYHPISVLKDLVLFVRRNNRWTLEKGDYFGIKTGAYKLTRVYRKYYKKQKEEEVCPKCGRSYGE